MQGLKPRIYVEYLGKYTEMHSIAYGIVADIFFARYSLLVTRCSLLEFNYVFLKYMFQCQTNKQSEYSYEAGRLYGTTEVIRQCTDMRHR